MTTKVLSQINQLARRARICTFFLGAMFFPWLAGAADLLSVPATPLAPSVTASGDSSASLISPDGRFVVFTSTANNLVHRTNGAPYILARPSKLNAFVRDRVQGTTSLISVDPTDTIIGYDDSIPTAISTNGQFVLFESGTHSLVTGQSINGNDSEIYLRDLVNHTTTLVSPRTYSPYNRGPGDAVMTPDARYVAFSSGDANFVPDDTNGIPDIFVRDLVSGQTRLVSGGLTNQVSCFDPEITPDGKFVVFCGSSRVDGREDVYVCDLSATNTFCVSTNILRGFFAAWFYGQEINQDGKYVVCQCNSVFSPSGPSIFRHNLQTGADELVASNAVLGLKIQPLDLSPDGRFVAFIGQTNSGTGVFLWDGQTATTTLVSSGTNGFALTNAECRSPTFDTTGRYLSFVAIATGLVTNSVGAFQEHVYRHDLLNGTTEVVDLGMDGTATNRTLSGDFGMTPGGRYFAFGSSDTDFVAQDGNRASDVFVRDMDAATNELISVAEPLLPTTTGGHGDWRTHPAITADSSLAVFLARNDGLVSGFTNRYRSVVVRDLIHQTNDVICMDINGLRNADGAASEFSMSADGRYIAFTSLADNLVPNDFNRAGDVFLRDRQTGITTLVSTNTSNLGTTNNESSTPVLSSDGRYVTYFSVSSGIAPTLGFRSKNLFFYDRNLQTNYALTTYFANIAATTPDGRYVAFFGSSVSFGNSILYVWDSQSKQRVYTNSASITSLSSLTISTNGRWLSYGALIGGTNSLFLTDRLTKSNILVSTGPLSFHANPRFSGDGLSLVYATKATNAANDLNATSDVYVFDVTSRSNTLVSRSFFSGNAAAGSSEWPDISADGRYITYESDAPDLVPFNNGRSSKNVFLYDRQNASTVLLSASAYGGTTGDFTSQYPVFTGDGQTVAFQSWATDLTTNDFNQGSDVFMVKILSSTGSTNPAPVLVGPTFYRPGSGPGSGQGLPLLSWSAVAGAGYQVQYKTNLTDDVWLPVNGVVVLEGGQGYVTDLAPDPNHRFYRIVAY